MAETTKIVRPGLALTHLEIDGLWEKLSEGGEKIQCGWLGDKYGFPVYYAIPYFDCETYVRMYNKGI